MKPIDMQKLQLLETINNEIAVDMKARMKALGQEWGFCLFMFSFGEGSEMTYIANAPRGDMILALKEFIAKVETGQGDELNKNERCGHPFEDTAQPFPASYGASKVFGFQPSKLFNEWANYRKEYMPEKVTALWLSAVRRAFYFGASAAVDIIGQDRDIDAVANKMLEPTRKTEHLELLRTSYLEILQEFQRLRKDVLDFLEDEVTRLDNTELSMKAGG